MTANTYNHAAAQILIDAFDGEWPRSGCNVMTQIGKPIRDSRGAEWFIRIVIIRGTVQVTVQLPIDLEYLSFPSAADQKFELCDPDFEIEISQFIKHSMEDVLKHFS